MRGNANGNSAEVLTARLVTSACASAQIVKIDAARARRGDGVVAVLLAEDLLAESGSGQPVSGSLLAQDSVHYAGQPLAVIVAENDAACRLAEAALEIQLHSAPAVLSVEHAEALGRHHGEARGIRRGDAVRALAASPQRMEGSISIASQAPFGRETLCAEVWPTGRHGGGSRNGISGVRVAVTAEAPSRVRSAVATAIAIPEAMVHVAAMPLSDLCGGREREAGVVAALAAVAAVRTGRPVRLELSRSQDLALVGGRAETQATFQAGYDIEGRVLALEVAFSVDGGWTLGDAEAVRDRILLHADGAYFIADFQATCQLCRTNRVTTAAMPAEGAAQASLVMEEIIARIAHRLDLPSDVVRARNLYRTAGDRLVTPYGQKVDAGRLERVWKRAVAESDLAKRREEIANWNARNPCYKRGIGIVPVKLGVGDPRSNRNQTTIAVHLLVDGSAVVHLGIAPSCDGMNEPVRRMVAAALGIPQAKVAVHRGNLDAVNHSTVAHAVDFAGLAQQAVELACEELRVRLLPVASQLLAAEGGAEIDADAIRFADEKVWAGTRSVELAQVVDSAWRRRVGLSVVGHCRTPKLWWDPEVGGGWPFEYFALGAAVVEVQLDAFTGEAQLLRADLALDLGGSEQGAELTAEREAEAALISRAFQMGTGWQIHEALRFDADGRLMNGDASAYPTPGMADAALDFRLHRGSEGDAVEGEIRRPQTVVEAPLVLAIAGREALREAIRAFGAGPDVEVELAVPAVPEAVLAALRDLSRRVAEANRKAAEQAASAAQLLAAEKVAADKVAAEKAAAEKAAAEKAAAEKAAADKVAAEKAAAEKAAAEKAAAEKAAAEKAAAEKAAADKVAAEKAAADKVAADKVAADKVAADKVAADKAIAAKEESAKVEPAKVEPAKDQPLKGAPIGIAQVKVAPMKIGPVKISPSQVTPIKVTPLKNVPRKVEATQVSRPKIISVKGAPIQVTPLKNSPPTDTSKEVTPPKDQPPTQDDDAGKKS